MCFNLCKYSTVHNAMASGVVILCRNTEYKLHGDGASLLDVSHVDHSRGGDTFPNSPAS